MGAVDLLCSEWPDHLVGERHGPEAHERMGARSDARSKAVGTAYHKHDVSQSPVLQVLNVFREGQ